MKHRVLPNATEAEASILGGIILRNSVLAQLDTLEVEAFFDPRHRVVFGAMRALEAANKPIDVVTLEGEITKHGRLDAIGGVAFLGELVLRVPTVDNVLVYAETVDQKHRARQLMLAAGDLVERGYESDLDVDEYFAMAMAMLGKLDRVRVDRSCSVGEMVKRRVRELEQVVQAKQRGEQPRLGVPTGIAALDAEIGGYPLGDVSLIAARPAMGKTSMAMSCVDAATLAGYGAHVFSQEGGWRMYADRAIARGSGVSVKRLRAGDIDAEGARGIVGAMANYNARPHWHVDSDAGMTASEIVRRVRKMRSKLNTKLVLVDYVQLVKRVKSLEDNENAALDEIITTFSNAALVDDIAYVVLSQLNRKVEDRTDKRPQLADLRGSGALEERPRVVVSPYRGSYYYPEPKSGIDFDCDCIKGAPCRCAPSTEDFEKAVQVLILKNNNGQTGRVFASWSGATTEMK